MYTFLCGHVFSILLGVYLSRIVGSYLFNILRDCQIVFQNGCTFLPSYIMLSWIDFKSSTSDKDNFNLINVLYQLHILLLYLCIFALSPFAFLLFAPSISSSLVLWNLSSLLPCKDGWWDDVQVLAQLRNIRSGWKTKVLSWLPASSMIFLENFWRSISQWLRLLILESDHLGLDFWSYHFLIA